MQSLPRRLTLGLAVPLAVAGSAVGIHSHWPQAGAPVARPLAPAAQAAPVGTAVSNPLSALGVPPAAKAAVNTALASAPDLSTQIRWVDVRYGKGKARTPDAASRLLLVQAAAEKAGLDEVGLSYEDVYGLINAETSWVPRTGMGKTGTRSLGLAQFEPGTAKALGLRNPNDPVQAVFAAASHMKTAAEWAADRLEPLQLPPAVYAQKLREGVSVYYNLSWKGRKAWNGLNTAQLPVETRRHIANTRTGAERAQELATELGLDIEG